MSPRKNSCNRGFTLTEMLTVMVLFGVIGTFVVAVLAPIVNAPNEQAAKIDTTQTGADALFRIQRDLRNGDASGVYVCTYPAPTTCSVPAQYTSGLASSKVVAILTPQLNGDGGVQWGTKGDPAWQGYQVYWLVSDGSGNGTYNLEYAFSSDQSGSPGLPTAGADSAVGSALGSTSPETVAEHVLSLDLDTNATTKTTGLSISSQSTVGDKVNESTFAGDTFSRN